MLSAASATLSGLGAPLLATVATPAGPVPALSLSSQSGSFSGLSLVSPCANHTKLAISTASGAAASTSAATTLEVTSLSGSIGGTGVSWTPVLGVLALPGPSLTIDNLRLTVVGATSRSMTLNGVTISGQAC